MSKNLGGRPKSVTPEVIRKLEEAFKWGCTDLEACCNADLASSTFYDYCRNNPMFSERKETLKNNLLLRSKMTVSFAVDDGDVPSAHKVIDRKEGSKVSTDITSGGKPLNSWVVTPVSTDKS